MPTEPSVDTESKRAPTIAPIISVTLGLVGATGCGSDPISNTNTTTTYSSVGEDVGTDTGTDSSEGTGTGTSTSTTDYYDPTDYYNPCAGWDPEPIVLPIEVTDWLLTSMTYETIRSETEIVTGQAWNDLDDATRCLAACAFATGYLGDLSPGYVYGMGMLELRTCELTIPTLEADGVLQCSGTHTYTPGCPGGRAPLTWCSPAPGDGSLAHHLDAMATMEAVSITAFDELAAQLERLGAPASLIARCYEAAGDEARHLCLLEQLGGRGPLSLPKPASAETSALAIALHNAVEGCVNETWAALLARHQAEHAADQKTRRIFAVIADDEARHAQLAWDLHVWLGDLLTPQEAARVESSRAAALAELEQLALQQALAIDAHARRRLGLPDPRRAGALARVFGQQLAAA